MTANTQQQLAATLPLSPAPAFNAAAHEDAVSLTEEELAALHKKFMDAARRGDAKALSDMLARTPQLINKQDGAGDTALIEAVRTKRLEAAEVLLQSGADPNIDNNIPFSALIYAISNKHAPMVELLLAYKADPNHKADISISPLTFAVEMLVPEIVNMLLKYEADTEAADEIGQTAAFSAVMQGDTGMLYLLKSHGAKMDVRRDNGDSLLDISIRESIHPVFDMLMDFGVNILEGNDRGVTPAHHAAAADNTRALDKLRQKGALMDYADKAGNTPMMHAAIAGAVKSTGRLLAWGLPFNPVNGEGRDARRLAQENNHGAVVQLINAANGRLVGEALQAVVHDDITPPQRARFAPRKRVQP